MRFDPDRHRAHATFEDAVNAQTERTAEHLLSGLDNAVNQLSLVDHQRADALRDAVENGTPLS